MKNSLNKLFIFNYKLLNILPPFYLLRYYSNNTSNNCNSIIIWGTNLSSNIGHPTFLTTIQKIVSLPHYQLSVVIGLLLSDASLWYPTKRAVNVVFKFKQSLNKFEYVWKIFNILSYYCKSYPFLEIGKRKNTRTVNAE